MGVVYEVPFKVGSYIERKHNRDIIDQVTCYKIVKSGIKAVLLLDINCSYPRVSNDISLFDLTDNWDLCEEKKQEMKGRSL